MRRVSFACLLLLVNGCKSAAPPAVAVGPEEAQPEVDAIDIAIPLPLDAIVYTTCDATLSIGVQSSMVHLARSDLSQEKKPAPQSKAAGVSWHVREKTTPGADSRFFAALSDSVVPPVWIGAKAKDRAEFEGVLATVSLPGSPSASAAGRRLHRVGGHAFTLPRSSPFQTVAMRDSKNGFAAAAHYVAPNMWSFEEAKLEKKLAGKTLRYAKGSSPLRDDAQGGPPNPAHRLWYGYVELGGRILLIRAGGDPFTEAHYLRFAEDVITAATLHPGASC